jgi:5-methylcytosine-specific restriction enzyme B
MGKRWNNSETKKIFGATKRSEELMSYLDEKLYEKGIAIDCTDNPNYERKNGYLVYYLAPNKRVLLAAPRKRDDYIHVTIYRFSFLESKVRKMNIKRGNTTGKQFDVMLYSEKEIDQIIDLIYEAINNLFVGKEVVNRGKNLSEWVKEYLEDKDNLAKIHLIKDKRLEFLSYYPNLVKQLKSGEINILEFKRLIDQKLKQKYEIYGEKVNLWGFSGYSGQMFFNQLYNQADFVNLLDEFQQLFLMLIEIPDHEAGDFSWTKSKFRDFVDFIKKLEKEAIENGYPLQKCCNIKFSSFFLSFFWALQDMKRYPFYYSVSREGLDILGYKFSDDSISFDEALYIKFSESCRQLIEDIEGETGQQFDMHDLTFFLQYVVSVTEKRSDIQTHSVPKEDPLALKIQEVLNDLGYVVSNFEIVDENEILLTEQQSKTIWKYVCKQSNKLFAILFVWQNEYSVSFVYVENEEGNLKCLGEVRTDTSDQDLLENLSLILQKRTSYKRTYTIDDAVRETYLQKELLEEWLELLWEYKQVIFYGPPGTGKTFVAQRLAKILTQSDNEIQLIQFHPSYTYEEFIEGLRPELIKAENGFNQITVSVKSGVFAELCRVARKKENLEKSYVLIIDEINRANTAKVFGELLYALEYRNTPVPLPYSRSKLIIPENVFIIGTMNTTDRSLSQLDFALRRRFQFIPFTYKETSHVLKHYLEEHCPEFIWVYDLVELVNEKIGNLDISIGHSYFIGKKLTKNVLERIWKYQIIPYLEECFVYQPEKLEEFMLPRLLSELNQYDHL